MSTTEANTLEPISEAELKALMGTMAKACDVVRVVEPATFDARTLEEGGQLNEPYKCYSALCRNRRCENCISMRAVEEARPVSKFDFVDGEAYFITARPFSIDGKPHSLEMVQKVSDDIGLQSGHDEFQEQVQAETDAEFVDGFTGAYSRNYFDEGLSSLPGRKLAMVQVENLARINKEEGYPAGDLVLKGVAHEILVHTRVEDTVVHYKGDKFAVQFEDVDSENYPALIHKIAAAVDAVVIEGHPGLRPVAYVAAVDEDATFGELAARALDLLEQAKRSGEHVLITMSDPHHLAAEQARAAADVETLRRSPDKPIADKDALTGLLSPSAIRAHIQQIVKERHARSEGYCVIYLDIENFKQFNRTYGVQGGDLLIEYIAKRIRVEFPAGTAARMGGDLFVVATNEENIRERLRSLHASVAAYQDRISCEIKAGVYALDEAVHDAAMAIDLAKVACESIKGRFDISARLYDSALDQEISMNEYVVNNIEHAIAEGLIKVYYQPIVRAMTGHVCDYEALARWDDPLHGLLPPKAFIGALERFHLINKLDEYIVGQACAHQAAILAAGKQAVPVSVNLSRLDFQMVDVFAMVEQAVANAGIPRNLLNIEVTESALDEDSGYFAEQLEQFRQAGYEVWMDDFGSGYSSLNLLKDYRFDALKIDMAFLAGFEHNPKSREIIVTVVDMAKKLGIRTLVEGVETKQQYRFLQRIGCEMLQGFYFGKPRPYDEDAFAGLIVEDARERAYFDALGSVNLLGLPSSGGLAGAADYITESESRSTPMALVEYRNGSYGYLSANEAYLELLVGMRVATLEDAQEALSTGMTVTSEALIAQLKSAQQEGQETVKEAELQSALHKIHVRPIATAPGAEAFVIVPIALQ